MRKQTMDFSSQKLRTNNMELKPMRFLHVDGKWKRTFRVSGPYCLPDFYTSHL